MPKAPFVKYGETWEAGTPDLPLEFAAIRLGGKWTNSAGKQCGLGLFEHYKRAQQLLWPEDDHHSWSDLILSTILDNRITVVMGSRDTGKTHVALCRFGLTDYFAFADETLILISSTDIRGLELRVWGDLKDMFGKAKELWPELPGHVLDSKHGIFTDNLEGEVPVRDMRRGIICIPCLGGNGEWVGLEKYVGIKQKRRRLLGDEVQFMRLPYLNTFANLDKGDFKGVFAGNPIAQQDPLDKLAEPEGGWDSQGQITKTSTWKNRMGGVTLNLVGIDSPNFHLPAGQPAKYPYLIDRDDEQRVALRYGKDSSQYWSQIMGVRKAGLDSHRFLTRTLCLRFDAFKECIWDGSATTKVYGLDAGFGGDRAVGGYIEFGKEVGGHIVVKVHPPHVIPILLSLPGNPIPEEQLAASVKVDIDAAGIPAANVFFDAGMRATLATHIARVVGLEASAINFGGNATSRPVSNDDFVFDETIHSKRLKRCDEAYSKFVTELWWSVRLAVESRQIRELPESVAQEFYMREWTKVTGDRYEAETKEETKARMGQSPDEADWLCICLEGARRLGFVIERMRTVEEVKTDDRWLEKELQKHKQWVKTSQLNYA